MGPASSAWTARCDLSVSRNIGIAAAAGDIVGFIDDDAVPHPDWLDRILAPYRDPRVGAVGGHTVDNTGRRYQARKILCDRFGNAHHVSDFFDERPLNRPGSPIYPSLLGTNSTFRMTALRQSAASTMPSPICWTKPISACAWSMPAGMCCSSRRR